MPRRIGTTDSEGIAPKPPSESVDTDEWIAIPRPRQPGAAAARGGNGHAPDVDREPAQAPKALKKRKLPKRASPRERWLINRLRRARQRIDDQQEEIDRLRAEIKKLQGAERKVAPKRKPAARAKGKIDLQKASFEDLRGLGLSVTQSARLIAYRDTGPGFDSVEELENIPGFAEVTIGKLRARARVGTR